MIITQATSADILGMANILTEWNASTPWMPRVHSRADEKEFVREIYVRNWVTVARGGGRLMGFVARNGPELHALYVARSARGFGVGKALLDHEKRQVGYIGLYAFSINSGARRFYLREGFIEQYETDGTGNDEKLPDVRYEWKAEK